MIDALLANKLINRLKDVPWEVVPYTLLGLAAVLLLFWALNKLLTPFFREEIEDYAEEERDYE